MSPSPYFTLPFLLIVAVFQSTAATRLEVMGGRPDLMLASVLAWTLLASFRTREFQYAVDAPGALRGINDGVVWGFAGGILLDLMSRAPMGSSSIALMVVATVAGILSVGMSGAAPVMIELAALGGTFLFHLVFLVELAATGHPASLAVYASRTILPSAGLNLIVVPLVYLLLSTISRRMGTPRERLRW